MHKETNGKEMKSNLKLHCLDLLRSLHAGSHRVEIQRAQVTPPLQGIELHICFAELCLTLIAVPNYHPGCDGADQPLPGHCPHC